MPSDSPPMRAIGRTAVRDELARLALPQFIEEGFDSVTFDVLATAAGVSRSTYLRYFSTKEDVVLFVFDPLGVAIVDALGERPQEEAEWDALRRCLDPAIEFFRDAADRREMIRLIWKTPALYSSLHEKQASWRPRMAEQLSARGTQHLTRPLAVRTRVAAALECLTVALEWWLTEGESTPLENLLDQTFAAISPAH